MKYSFLTGCLLLAGCSTSPPPLTPQQAAVTALVESLLPDSASYEPVSWRKMVPFRASEPATDDLPGTIRYYEKAKAKLQHDSSGYALVSTQARELNLADRDVANVKMVYQMSLTDRNGSRAELRHLLATKNDTTRLGYRLFHVFRAKDEKGELLLDSAGFLVNLNGVVICNISAHHFVLSTGPSNREQFLEISPPLPPPPPPAGVSINERTPEQLKAYLKEPMKR